MLTLTITVDYFDDEKQEFVSETETVLELEHSLVSISKWESIWEVPFLSDREKTSEETLSYIEAMTLTPEISPEVYSKLSNDNIHTINKYIASKMSASWVNEEASKGPSEVVTSELIYYWMIGFNIPFECQTWHLNRLLMLIRICNRKQTPPKKMSTREIAQRNRELNEKRRAMLNSSG